MLEFLKICSVYFVLLHCCNLGLTYDIIINMNKNFLNREIVSLKDLNQMNILELAFIGDSVFELYVKNELVKKIDKVKNLTIKASSILNAHSQCEAFFRIQDKLTDDERNVVMRGRNATIHTKAKNFSIEEYRYATALESLIGYLYLTGRDDRLEDIFNEMKLFGEE